MKEASLKDLQQFASDVMLMKHKAGELGLYKTMHAFEPATQAVGWEIAEILEGKRNDIKISDKEKTIFTLKRMSKNE